MIEIATTQLASGYFKTTSFINNKPFSSCIGLDREYTIRAVEKDCKIAKQNLK